MNGQGRLSLDDCSALITPAGTKKKTATPGPTAAKSKREKSGVQLELGQSGTPEYGQRQLAEKNLTFAFFC